MKLKKYLITGFMLLACAVQANAKSDFGSFMRYIFSIPEPKPTIEKSAPEVFREVTDDINEKITDINTKATMLDITTAEGFLSIVSMLSSSNDIQQIKSNLNYIQYDPTLTDMEKSVAIDNIIADFQTKLTENSDAYVNKIKKLSPANKKLFIEKLTLLSDNGKEYIKLGRKSASSANRYISLTKEGDDRADTIGEMNTLTGKYTQRAQAIVYLTSELKNIARMAGIGI